MRTQTEVKGKGTAAMPLENAAENKPQMISFLIKFSLKDTQVNNRNYEVFWGPTANSSLRQTSPASSYCDNENDETHDDK